MAILGQGTATVLAFLVGAATHWYGGPLIAEIPETAKCKMEASDGVEPQLLPEAQAGNITALLEPHQYAGTASPSPQADSDNHTWLPWLLIASLPLDCLLMLAAFGKPGHPWRYQKQQAPLGNGAMSSVGESKKSKADGILGASARCRSNSSSTQTGSSVSTSPSSPKESTEVSDGLSLENTTPSLSASASMGEATPTDPKPMQPAPSPLLPIVSKQKDTNEVKQWMARLRGQCEVVGQSQQALIETDAKSQFHQQFASNSSRASASSGTLLQVPAATSACGVQRPVRRNLDLQAKMNSLRDQCEIVEGSQEFVDTDAKASASKPS